jgi:hypothetical protein
MGFVAGERWACLRWLGVGQPPSTLWAIRQVNSTRAVRLHRVAGWCPIDPRESEQKQPLDRYVHDRPCGG